MQDALEQVEYVTSITSTTFGPAIRAQNGVQSRLA
jgi:hypothetical protein